MPRSVASRPVASAVRIGPAVTGAALMGASSSRAGAGIGVPGGGAGALETAARDTGTFDTIGAGGGVGRSAGVAGLAAATLVFGVAAPAAWRRINARASDTSELDG